MATRQFLPETPELAARRKELRAAKGLVNGIIFTLGLWLGLTGLVLLLLR